MVGAGERPAHIPLSASTDRVVTCKPYAPALLIFPLLFISYTVISASELHEHVLINCTIAKFDLCSSSFLSQLMSK